MEDGRCDKPDLPIDLPVAALAAFCRSRRIRRLALFGSLLRGDPRPDSDIDLLVEFEPGATPGLGFFVIEDELSQLLGRTVDLNTIGFLSPDFAHEVVREARTIYVAA